MKNAYIVNVVDVKCKWKGIGQNDCNNTVSNVVSYSKSNATILLSSSNRKRVNFGFMVYLILGGIGDGWASYRHTSVRAAAVGGKK